ncbi:enolase C-terminal domain-like protein [Streptomyces sp. NPDC048442]|uniref:enolase C-terminal domain-like protein n=1 Tax=Streptomyces sp. NPDC048442 TaxID=3154823 RepID=UPI00343728AA
MPEIELYEARVPMRRPFRHAAKARTASASVLVAVREDGVTGWGESAPREYVTGESVESVLASLGRPEVLRSAVEILGLPFDEALSALAGYAPGLAPAAAAGLETALFDHLCRRAGVSGLEALHRAGFGDVLAARPAPAPVATVLDLGRDPVGHLTALSDAARAAIPHLKLKAGPEPQAAAESVARVRGLLPAGTTVSVDANCAWEAPEVLRRADALLAAGVSWLEEPLAPRSWPELAALRRAGLRVMLDESFVSTEDLADCVTHRAADLVNLRVSKCGGPLRLLTALRVARRAGLGVQLGVQVGEVGPLWATGRLIATALPYAEAVEAGRQDEWFPPELTAPAYEVDRGTSRAPALTGPGIGLKVTPELLGLCEPRGKQSADIHQPTDTHQSARTPQPADTHRPETTHQPEDTRRPENPTRSTA